MSIKTIRYLGHSAVLLEANDTIIAIDPWLEDNPSCPEPWKSPKKIDLIVLTHGHSDHASDTVRLAKSLGSKVAATWELAMIMGNEGVPQQNLIPMNKGGGVEFKNFTITLTHAFHSSSYDTKNGAVYAGEPCGVIVNDKTKSIYHAGDTALFSDMKLIGETYKPEVALLPIGDRFTMGPKEAARAAALIGCKIAIPIHYATFDLLTGTAEQFEKACAGQECKVMKLGPGEHYSF